MVSSGVRIFQTQSSKMSLSLERLKEYSFILFHHIFWNKIIFEGIPVSVGLLGVFGPSSMYIRVYQKNKFFSKNEKVQPTTHFLGG